MAQPPLSFIHRFVPAQSDTPSVTLLLLHGTGGNEDNLLDLGHILLPQAALLSPRGKVLENGMPRFFRRVAEGVFDVEDLKARAAELADFVDAAAEHHGFDRSRVIAVGFSNGANIAAGILLVRPGSLAGALLLSPMVPFEPDEPVDLAGTPVFIGAGRLDPIAPPGQTEGVARILQESHARVMLHWHEGGHSISPDEVQAARDWLTRVAAA